MPEEKARQRKEPISTVVGLSLIDVDLDLDPTFEEEKEVELRYNIEITQPKRVDTPDAQKAYLFTTDVSIGKSRKGTEKLESTIRASYVCGFICRSNNESDALKVAKKYAQTTIWGNFVSLAAVLVQQTSIQFPLLPPMPGKVAVAPDALDDSVEGDYLGPSR